MYRSALCYASIIFRWVGGDGRSPEKLPSYQDYSLQFIIRMLDVILNMTTVFIIVLMIMNMINNFRRIRFLFLMGRLCVMMNNSKTS